MVYPAVRSATFAPQANLAATSGNMPSADHEGKFRDPQGCRTPVQAYVSLAAVASTGTQGCSLALVEHDLAGVVDFARRSTAAVRVLLHDRKAAPYPPAARP